MVGDAGTYANENSSTGCSACPPFYAAPLGSTNASACSAMRSCTLMLAPGLSNSMCVFLDYPGTFQCLGENNYGQLVSPATLLITASHATGTVYTAMSLQSFGVTSP